MVCSFLQRNTYLSSGSMPLSISDTLLLSGSPLSTCGGRWRRICGPCCQLTGCLGKGLSRSRSRVNKVCKMGSSQSEWGSLSLGRIIFSANSRHGAGLESRIPHNSPNFQNTLGCEIIKWSDSLSVGFCDTFAIPPNSVTISGKHCIGQISY